MKKWNLVHLTHTYTFTQLGARAKIFYSCEYYEFVAKEAAHMWRGEAKRARPPFRCTGELESDWCCKRLERNNIGDDFLREKLGDI